MNRVNKTITVALVIVFGLASIPPANSATSLLNKSCSKINSTKTNNGVKLICKSVAGKKVWKKAPSSSAQQTVKSVPLIVPQFNLSFASSVMIEKGTHDSLLLEKGLYYAMWRQQIGERRMSN